MDLAQLPLILGSLVSVAGAGVSLWQTAQGARRVQAETDKTAIEGFALLCERLEARIDANDREIAALKTELAEVKAENEALRQRVRELERENAELKAFRDKVEARQRKRGKKGQAA